MGAPTRGYAGGCKGKGPRMVGAGQLSGAAIFFPAFRDIAQNRAAAAGALILPAVALFAIELPLSMAYVADPYLGGGGLELVRFVIFCVAIGLLASRWHRAVILGETVAALPRGDALRRAIRYALSWFVIGFILGLVAILVTVVLALGFTVLTGIDGLSILDLVDPYGAGTGPGLGAVVGVALMALGAWLFIYMLFRGAYGLPEQAVTGAGRGIRASFARTRVLARGLVVTSALATLVQGAIHFAFYPVVFERLLWPYDAVTGDPLTPGLGALVLGSALLVLVDLAIALVGAAILTVIYREVPPEAEAA